MASLNTTSSLTMAALLTAEAGVCHNRPWWVYKPHLGVLDSSSLHPLSQSPCPCFTDTHRMGLSELIMSYICIAHAL